MFWSLNNPHCGQEVTGGVAPCMNRHADMHAHVCRPMQCTDSSLGYQRGRGLEEVRERGCMLLAEPSP